MGVRASEWNGGMYGLGGWGMEPRNVCIEKDTRGPQPKMTTCCFRQCVRVCIVCQAPLSSACGHIGSWRWTVTIGMRQGDCQTKRGRRIDAEVTGGTARHCPIIIFTILDTDRDNVLKLLKIKCISHPTLRSYSPSVSHNTESGDVSWQ